MDPLVEGIRPKASLVNGQDDRDVILIFDGISRRGRVANRQ